MTVTYKMYSYLRTPTEAELEHLNLIRIEQWKEVPLINGITILHKSTTFEKQPLISYKYNNQYAIIAKKIIIRPISKHSAYDINKLYNELNEWTTSQT